MCTSVPGQREEARGAEAEGTGRLDSRHLWPQVKAEKLEGYRDGRSENEELMNEEHIGLKGSTWMR